MKAQCIVGKVEMGLISDDQMKKTEQQLTVLLAAMQDKVLLKVVPSHGGRGIVLVSRSFR